MLSSNPFASATLLRWRGLSCRASLAMEASFVAPLTLDAQQPFPSLSTIYASSSGRQTPVISAASPPTPVRGDMSLGVIQGPPPPREENADSHLICVRCWEKCHVSALGKSVARASAMKNPVELICANTYKGIA